MKDPSTLTRHPKQSRTGSWLQALSPPAFPGSRVDVWRVRLDEPAKTDFEASVLSPDEIARANRFHFENDRIHFTRCRSALRSVLAGYLAIPAVEIRFDYLATGKPRLAAEQNPRALQFNVSHSANMALIAVMRSDPKLPASCHLLKNRRQIEARFLYPLHPLPPTCCTFLLPIGGPRGLGCELSARSIVTFWRHEFITAAGVARNDS